MRRARNDGCAFEAALQLFVREKPERAGNLPAQRAVPDDHERHPIRRGNQLADAFLGRQPPRVEDLRRIRGVGNLHRQFDPARDRPHVRRPQPARLVCERSRRRDHEPRPLQNAPRERWSTTRELDVRPPHLHDERLAGRHRDEARRKPVGMDEIRAHGGPSRSPGEARQHERQRGRQVWPATQVPGDARAVGDPVVPEARGRHDLDLDAARTQVLDLVGDEEAGDVTRPARVRRRQDDDLQGSSRRANTTGVARAIKASA